MVFMSSGSTLIRWIGALYLVYLGARQLLQFRAAAATGAALPPHRARRQPLLRRAVLVSLSNPKVLLFLGAFLPQFVDPAARSGVASSGCWPCCSSSCSPPWTWPIRWRSPGRATTSMPAALRLLDGAAGVLLLPGGLALAMARRP